MNVAYRLITVLFCMVVMMNASYATVTVFDDQAAWQNAAGPSDTIDFATDDAGNPFTNPPSELFFSALTLKGVTFMNGMSYYNLAFSTVPGTPLRARLPDNTTAFGLVWGLRAEFPGLITFRLSTGEIFYPDPSFIPYALGNAFFGVTSTTPIEWVEFSMNSTSVLIGDFFFVTPPLPVAIDIKPGSGANPVNLAAGGVIPVALLSSPGFSTADIDWPSLRFGRTGTEADLTGYSRKDMNGDGLPDLMLHFRTAETGLQCGNVDGILTGQTVQGKKFKGVDRIRTICPPRH